MKIYTKYLFFKLIVTFFILNFVFLGLVSLVQTLKFIYLINKGAFLSDVVDVVILSMPSLLFVILPLSTCLSVSYSYSKFIYTGEVTLLRIMGLNNLKIAMPGLIFSFIITGFTYYMMLTISPIFFTKLKNLMFELRNNYTLELIQENSFNKVSKNVTIYVGDKIKQDTFDNILIFDKSEPAKLFVAQNGSLKFTNGLLELILHNGVAQTVGNNLQFNEFVVKIDLYGNKTTRTTKDLEEYTIGDLLRSDQLKFLADAHKRIVWPFYSLLLTSFALSALLARNYIDLKVKIRIAIYNLILVVAYFGFYVLSIKNSYFLYLQYVFAFCFLSISLLRMRYLAT